MNVIRKMWFENKPLFISLFMFLLLLIRIIFNTLFLFNNLTTVSGTVNKLDVSNEGSKTYLTIGIHNDNNIYYQRYKNRFFDEKIELLQKEESVNFFTSKTGLYSAAPLWNDGQQKGFYYYPIFNINNSKSILSVFLFNFYKLDLLNLLFYISIISSLLYSFFFFVHSKGITRIILLIFLAAILWLWY